MHTDPISDFLTRLRNGLRAGHETVDVPASTMKRALAHILVREGYISAVEDAGEAPKKMLHVTLKYEGKDPAIHAIRRLSKPGQRLYRKANELPRVLSDLGIAIVSTSAGVMTNKEARKRKLGGELICEVM